MSAMGGRLLWEKFFENVFEELQAGDGIEGILASLDNLILIAVATAKRFSD